VVSTSLDVEVAHRPMWNPNPDRVSNPVRVSLSKALFDILVYTQKSITE